MEQKTKLAVFLKTTLDECSNFLLNKIHRRLVFTLALLIPVLTTFYYLNDRYSEVSIRMIQIAIATSLFLDVVVTAAFYKIFNRRLLHIFLTITLVLFGFALIPFYADWFTRTNIIANAAHLKEGILTIQTAIAATFIFFYVHHIRKNPPPESTLHPDIPFSRFFSNITLLSLLAGFYPLFFHASNNITLIGSSLIFIGTAVCFVLPALFINNFVYYSSYTFASENMRKILLTASTVCLLVFYFNQPIQNFSFMKHIANYFLLESGQTAINAILVTIALLLVLIIRTRFYILTYMLSLTTFIAASQLGTEFLAMKNRIPAEWTQLEDTIRNIRFKKSINVYYIQPDGYANPSIMRKYYNFDNVEMENWLKKRGFTLYDDFRSNYHHTMLSNASMFNMKHHYCRPATGAGEGYGTREIIAGKNNAVEIFRSNGYKTWMLNHSTYLTLEGSSYDYCAVVPEYNEQIPFWCFLFGEAAFRRVKNDAVIDILDKIGTSRNFAFIEDSLPSHIIFHLRYTLGAEKERELYLQRLQRANDWLKTIINTIQKDDENALILISADHGGYVLFNAMEESHIYTKDEGMVNSMFSSILAIHWPKDYDGRYDKDLKSLVNLFRYVFAYMGDNHESLSHIEEDASFIPIDENAERGIYKALDENGQVVMKKVADWD